MQAPLTRWRADAICSRRLIKVGPEARGRARVCLDSRGVRGRVPLIGNRRLHIVWTVGVVLGNIDTLQVSLQCAVGRREFAVGQG